MLILDMLLNNRLSQQEALAVVSSAHELIRLLRWLYSSISLQSVHKLVCYASFGDSSVC